MLICVSPDEFATLIDALNVSIGEHYAAIIEYSQSGDFPDCYDSLDEAIACHECRLDLETKLWAQLHAIADEEERLMEV